MDVPKVFQVLLPDQDLEDVHQVVVIAFDMRLLSIGSSSRKERTDLQLVQRKYFQYAHVTVSVINVVIQEMLDLMQESKTLDKSL